MDSRVRQYRAHTNAAMRRVVAERSGSLGAASLLQDVLSTGGQRLRALIFLFTCNAPPANPADPRFRVAASIELVHLASLLLDDLPMFDNATTRRGRPAAHLVYGQRATLLFAVQLFAVATAELAACSLAGAVDALNAAVLKAAEGQRAEAEAEAAATGGSEVDPTGIAGLKTGALFALACSLGAMYDDGSSVRRHTQAYKAGLALGVAYQLVDDARDVREDPPAVNMWLCLGEDGGTRLYARCVAQALHWARMTNRDLAAYMHALVEDMDAALSRAARSTGSRHHLEQLL